MLDLGGVRDSAEFTRRLAITAGLLIAYRLGTFIPLPGIDPEALARLGGVAERISILALGITPFLSILILAELLKVLAPSVRRWVHTEVRNRDKLNRIVVALSLLAAAAQASGLVLALEDVPHLVDQPGTPFRLTCIATLVGSTAIVIWLADQITRHGLGSGVWLLLVTPWIADLLPRFAALASWQNAASLVAFELLIGIALAALVLAFAVRLINAGGGTVNSAETSLWSMLLAKSAWPWLLLVVALLLADGPIGLAPGHPAALIVLAALVALFVHLYLRSQRLAGITAISPIPRAVLGGGLAAITLFDVGLAAQLGWLVPLAGHLVIIAIVALSLLARWWQPPLPPEPRSEEA